MATIKDSHCDYNCYKCIIPCNERDKSVNYDDLQRYSPQR